MRSSAVRWLLVVTIVLVAIFVASTLFIQGHIAQVDAQVDCVERRASPAVQELASARSEVRHLELGAGRYLGTRSNKLPLPYPRAELERAQRGINQHLDAYARLPLTAEERAQLAALTALRDALFVEADRVVAAVDAGHYPEARSLLFGPFDPTADKLDALTVQAISRHAEAAREAGREIDRIRRRTRGMALALDGITIGVALLLLTLALRATRLWERLHRAQEAEAEARAFELDHFAARVAHDLKAPLTSVMMGVSAAQHYPQDATALLSRVRRSASSMNALIDALLEFARAGSTPVHDTPSPVAPVVDEIVAQSQAALGDAGTTLTVKPLPPGLTVACSAGALASILSNLVQNAIKYIDGAQGERRIEIRVEEQGSTVRLEVDDSGPGLSPESQATVFDMYVRAADGSHKPGLGLGLATVRRLVEAHAGRCGVQSTPGRGSCFWVELKRATVPQELPAPASNRLSPA